MLTLLEKIFDSLHGFSPVIAFAFVGVAGVGFLALAYKALRVIGTRTIKTQWFTVGGSAAEPDEQAPEDTGPALSPEELRETWTGDGGVAPMLPEVDTFPPVNINYYPFAGVFACADSRTIIEMVKSHREQFLHNNDFPWIYDFTRLAQAQSAALSGLFQALKLVIVESRGSHLHHVRLRVMLPHNLISGPNRNTLRTLNRHVELAFSYGMMERLDMIRLADGTTAVYDALTKPEDMPLQILYAQNAPHIPNVFYKSLESTYGKDFAEDTRRALEQSQ